MAVTMYRSKKTYSDKMTYSSTIRNLVAAALIAVCSVAAHSQAAPKGDLGQVPNQKPSILDQVGIDQHLNGRIPLDAAFLDENGQPVKLGQYFGQKPVIMTMVYYTCPMLCSEVLNGLTGALNGIVRFNVGRDFNVVAVSFDPRDTPSAAAAAKKKYVQRYRRAGSEQGLHFLTGRKDQIDAVAQALGFRYAWDPQISQYAHGSGVMLLTPDGRIAQYYYGIEYAPRDLQFGVIEASQGRIGNFTDKVLLYCYHYDPKQAKYGAAIFNILRLSGLATVLVLGGFIILMLRRDAAVARQSRLFKAS
jgi:protein SCO1